MTSIRDALVLVTGASSGLGEAFARLAATEGGRVILVARRAQELERVAESIRSAGGTAHVFTADLGELDAVADVTARIEGELGVPDILVNSAGAGVWRYVDETSPEEAVQLMAVPYFAAFAMTRAFLPQMLRRGAGHIVNITSVASTLVWPGATAYRAARCAMHGFTDGLQAELRQTGVKATLATFAKVASGYWDHNPGSEQRVPGAQALVRVLTPAQTAQAMLKGIRRERRLVMAPFELAFILGLVQLFPFVGRWLMRATSPPRRQLSSAGD